MSAVARILITTDYLRPGDEVDDLLRSRGHETRYRSGDLVADLAGVEGALVGHDPLTAEVLASADRLRAVVRAGVGYDAIVDEDALAAAVREGRIAGAALDVVAEEPLPAVSPLRGVPGIVVHSHLAGQTAQARRAAGVEGARELLDALAGRPKHAVNAHLIEERDNR